MESAIVVWTLDGQRFALWLSAVKRAIRLVEITRLPAAPAIVLGVINIAGSLIPIVDVRRRFQLPARELELSDHLLLAHTSRRALGFIVDVVEGVEVVSSSDFVTPAADLPGTAYLAGVLKREDGLTLIHDLDTFLSLDEEVGLQSALPRGNGATT